ncbi:MAG: hypothetical protein KDB53_00545 [Planctomycetes bacterium]|nr:hypothetical protein [Planctomycetota bacterium]
MTWWSVGLADASPVAARFLQAASKVIAIAAGALIVGMALQSRALHRDEE